MITFNILALLLLTIYVFNIYSSIIPLNLDDKNSGQLKFDVQLPNNDTVRIGLTFKLLTVSDTKNDTTTTTEKSPEKKIVTVEEAIEGFRQELIRKENEIAGFFESKDVFYRHFKLEFDDDKILKIRCTYDSNYEARSLNISCYEYHEFETERILSNGEVELIKQNDPNYKSDVEFVDLKTMKQTYKMTIS